MRADASPRGLPDARRRGRVLQENKARGAEGEAVGGAGAEPDTWRNAAQDQRKYDI